MEKEILELVKQICEDQKRIIALPEAMQRPPQTRIDYTTRTCPPIRIFDGEVKK